MVAWVHKWFWPARPGSGNFRFCKHKDCWPVEADQPSIEAINNLTDEGWRISHVFPSCCENKEGSTSSMLNHIREKHSELLPSDVPKERTSGGGGKPDDKVDEALMHEWSTNLILKKLHPITLIEDAKEIRSLKGLGGRSHLQKIVDGQIDDIDAEVTEITKAAVASGCRFAISADAWKTKLVKKDTYTGVMLDWCGLDWRRHSVCAGVAVMVNGKTAKDNCKIFQDTLEKRCVKATDVIAGVSDHESAVRKAMRDLGVNEIGCGCHAVQLAPKHATPPMRKKTARKTQSSSDGSSSSSTSSLKSSAPEAASDDQPKRKGRQPDAEHVAMRQEMEPICKRCRTLVKFYVHNPDAYRNLEADALQASADLGRKIHFSSFARETETRWQPLA